MLISEIYHSKQGEGLLTGKPSIFLRTTGCNLRCGFCDTPFASWRPEGDPMGIGEIVQRCQQLSADHGIEHVVITGGEPMIQKQMAELTSRIAEQSLHITIETAGTLDQEVQCNLMSISPKLSNSTPDPDRAGEWREKHELARHRPKVISRLMSDYDYQLKFVVDRQSDLAEIESYLAELDSLSRDRVLLMPQGITLKELSERQVWLEPYCEQHGYQFSPRKHIEWYGNKRGT